MGQLNQRRNQSEHIEKQRNPGSTASVLTQKPPQIHSKRNTKYEIQQPINTAPPIGDPGIADDIAAVVEEEEVEVEGVVEVGVVGVVVVVEVVGVSLVLSESEGGESLAGEGAAAESETFLALTLTASFMPP